MSWLNWKTGCLASLAVFVLGFGIGAGYSTFENLKLKNDLLVTSVQAAQTIQQKNAQNQELTKRLLSVAKWSQQVKNPQLTQVLKNLGVPVDYKFPEQPQPNTADGQAVQKATEPKQEGQE